MDNEGAKNLIMAIMTSAVKDAGDTTLTIEHSRNKRSAVRFLNSEDCQYYCECLGIDHNGIRDFLRDRREVRE